MNLLLRISLAGALAFSAAAPALAQDIPNRLRDNIIETYAEYADAFNAVRENSDDGGARRRMNEGRAKVLQLCARAELPEWQDCIVALIPMRDRTNPDKAFGAEGENIIQAEPQRPAPTPVPDEPENNISRADRQVIQAASDYTDAVRELRQAIADNRNTNRFVNRAEAAMADLTAACEATDTPRLNPCLNRLNLSVPDMPDVRNQPVRETDSDDAAALLDSQKDEENTGRRTTPVVPNIQITIPLNDQDSQANLNIGPVVSVQQERGTRIDEQPISERPTGRVIEQFGDRQVVELDDQLLIRSQDDSRMTEGASETYYEQLDRNRTRETIIRRDGVRVVTIYNANGDILQRSRFTPDGRETVLVYVSPEQEQQLQTYRDPGADLPPLQLGIPASEYILDADSANLNQVIDFLDSPPVERLQRYYSIDEVKRSARIRDMVRRLEIGNLTFEFGSPNLAPDQVNSLYQVASAMLTMLQQNPGEVFLIEGHTDAVGSDYANLLLSDQRAESVAIILTQVYGIPPENLATQGYGERYLKIRTPAAERLNRRVTVKRITPLIAPVPGFAAG